MYIVITNDDGIQSPGIRALWNELSSIADIAVVAPDSERSACSQSITVHHPIRVDKYPVVQAGVEAWSVYGTPTDCIKVALESLLSRTPDIIVSGINDGPNLGTDVLYSGTVSAAIEASLHGIPAIAVSLAAKNQVDYSTAARCARQLVEKVMKNNSLPQNTLLNVNIPLATAALSIKGIAITKLGKVSYDNVFEKRHDPRGRTYYWMSGNIQDGGNDPDSDVEAVRAGYVSVTPIHFDLTNYAIMDIVRNWGW